MKPRIVLVVLMGFLLNSPAAHALRCGNRLIDVGDSSSRLAEYCGAPLNREYVDDYRTVRTYDERRGDYVLESIKQPYEIWTYNFGAQRFLMRITIRAGVVTAIQSDGYGY